MTTVPMLLMAAARRRTLFDPLSLSPAHAYWAEGARFKALGLASGATLTTWPDEIGTADLGSVVGTPTYRPTGLGGRPSVQTATSGNAMSAAITTLPQPWTFVVVVDTTSTGVIGASTGAAAANQGLRRASFATGGVGISWTDPGNGRHLFIATASNPSSTVHMDGTLVASGASGTSSLSEMRLFSRLPGTTTGVLAHIAFAAVFGRVLTGTEQSYLRSGFQPHYTLP